MADQTISYRVTTRGTEKAAAGFKKLGLAVAGAFGGFALANVLQKAGTAFLDLDKGMRLVNTITKVSGEELKKLTSQVIDLSTELGTPTSQMTGAIYQAVSAGVAFEEIMEFMAVATKGAIAGNADVETSVDALTTILNTFKAEALSVTEISDIMFKTIELGKTDMAKLSSGYALAASTAAIAGIKFAEFSAAIALITFQGTKTATAMTSLRQAIIAINKNIGDGWRETMTFQEALKELIKRSKGSQNELLRMVSSVEALDAVLKLTGVSTDTFTQNLKETATAAGSQTVAFNEMEKSVSRDLQKIGVELENMGIVVVEVLVFVIKQTSIIANSLADKIGIVFQAMVMEVERVTKPMDALWKLMGLMPEVTLTLGPIAKELKKARKEFEEWIKETDNVNKNFKETISEVNKIRGVITELNKLQIEGNFTIAKGISIREEIIKLENILLGVVEKRFLLSEAFVASIKVRGLETFDPIGGRFDPEGFGDFEPTELAKLPATVVVGLREEMEEVGRDVFAGWNTLLSSNMISAWEDIFGEANSLFEKMLKDMTALLLSDVFSGLLTIFSGGTAGGVIGFIGGLFGGSSASAAQTQTIQINIGDIPFAQAVVNANGTIQQRRLIAQ